jgi:ADP-dependent NAD(P)H-hydrate dehydratase
MQREITRELVRRLLPGRMAESNKGSYGSVLAAAGSMAYRGAAALCTEGALRGGAGLVYLASVEPVIQLVLSRTPECCACGCRTAANGGIHPQDADALRRWFADRHAVLLAGPGLGESAADVCKALLGRNAPWAGAVLDADGLNAAAQLLAEGGAFPHPAGELIVTPHPGEMARLTGLSAAQINADREGTAQRYAQAWNAVVVLKGARTVVAAPDGRVRVNPTGNPGLSRGGSGDVLAGMTAALLACRLPAYEAAACAVYLHGAAADRAAAVHGEYGMLPHDILPELGRMFAEHQR